MGATFIDELVAVIFDDTDPPKTAESVNGTVSAQYSAARWFQNQQLE
jgi:hypothetical protein